MTIFIISKCFVTHMSSRLIVLQQLSLPHQKLSAWFSSCADASWQRACLEQPPPNSILLASGLSCCSVLMSAFHLTAIWYGQDIELTYEWAQRQRELILSLVLLCNWRVSGSCGDVYIKFPSEWSFCWATDWRIVWVGIVLIHQSICLTGAVCVIHCWT